MDSYDILIVGGGAAGIAAAKAARCGGAESILLAERGSSLGGVLRQCAHRGFDAGLTGTEYIEKLVADLPADIELCLDTTVVSVTAERRAGLVGPRTGDRTVSFERLIYAAGCREVAIGALPIAGTRPRGVYTAGHMQEKMNLHGFIPQDPVVILGSGDLGLIMAKEISELGLKVSLVEREMHCGGMARNQAFLKNQSVELILNSTVTEVHGIPELEGVTLSDGRYFPCRTLLTAVGLIPERELIWNVEREEWLVSCGNCNKIQPMVEAVVSESGIVGRLVSESIKG